MTKSKSSLQAAVYHFARPPYRFLRAFIRKYDWRTRRAVDNYLKSHPVSKLHIGCGTNVLQGWLNTEYESRRPSSVIYYDVLTEFPAASNSFDVIFSEHMIEHVPLPAGLKMLQECLRILKPGGRVRISTPPLEFLIKLLVNPDEADEAYLEHHHRRWSADAPVFTPAVVVADYYTQWGHKFVYDEPTLRALMSKAGFASITKVPLNESSEPALRNLEHEQRLPSGMLKLSTFTLEAVKPG